jgi:hypothetical protein
MARIGGRHLWRKVAAVIVATGLWFVVAEPRVVERIIRVPVQYANLPAGIEMTGEVANVIDIRVRGSEAALSRIVPGEMAAVVDLAGTKAGHRLFHVSGSDVRSPSGVEVMQVSPSNLTLGFESTRLKVVKVLPTVEGTPAHGFEVGAITASPAVVEVFGPAGALDNLQAVITEAVSVAGASSRVHETVTVGVQNRNLRIAAPQQVDVSVEVRSLPAERVVVGVLVDVRGSIPAMVNPANVTVTLKGSVETVNTLARVVPKAFVNVTTGGRGVRMVTVEVEVPAGVSVVSIDPEQLAVQVH